MENLNSSEQALLGKIHINYENQNFKETKRWCKEYIALYGQNPHILLLLTFAELDEDNFEKAFETANRILVYFRDFKVAYYLFGCIAWKKKDLKEAIRTFSFAIDKGLPKQMVWEATNNELKL